MNKTLCSTDKDIEEGKRLNDVFEKLSPEGKLQAQTYLSALRDKEMLEEQKIG